MANHDPMKRFDLSGRVALVTGASEGIGKGLAIGLGAAGAEVLLCSRRENLLLGVKAEIDSTGQRSHVCLLDVTKLESIQAAKSFCQKEFGKLDVLVNNAGFSVTRQAWLLSEEEWDCTVDVGLKGVFFCSQILGSLMRDRGYGKIINLASTMSKGVAINAAAYAAVKAGVAHLTEALAVEWATDGIRVNAIAPTSIPTPSRLPRMTPESRQRSIARIPLGRLGQVEDLIPAAIYLASEASDFVTGHTLYVDGGWAAHG